MKIIAPIFLVSSLLLLSSPSVFSADKDKSLLDTLSEEAKETSMDEEVVPEETVSEPSISPKAITDFSDLEEKIAAQIKGILVDKTENSAEGQAKNTKENFQNKLENIVSSKLLKGHKLDDIRTAVSAAMADIKKEGADNISVGTIDSATKALKSIVGKNKEIASGDKKDAYIQSLQTELSDESVTTDSKVVEPTIKKELKAAIVRDMPTPVSATTTSEVAKSEQTSTVLADTVTVLEGETLFKIAQRVYGSGENYLALYEANKDTIEDPNLIRIGQVLKIPK